MRTHHWLYGPCFSHFFSLDHFSDWFRGIYILLFFYFTFRTFRSSVLTFRAIVIVPLFSWKHFGRTDGQTERPTNGHPVQRTHPLMERKNTSEASLMSCATIYHCKCSISPFFTKVLCADQPTDRGADWQKDQQMDQWTDWEKDQRMDQWTDGPTKGGLWKFVMSCLTIFAL